MKIQIFSFAIILIISTQALTTDRLKGTSSQNLTLEDYFDVSEKLYIFFHFLVDVYGKYYNWCSSSEFYCYARYRIKCILRMIIK